MSLRIVFMGTPDFAVPTLIEIVDRGHEVVAVYTRAPKPAGRRGLDLTPSPVEREARRFALPVLTPMSLRSADPESIARSHGADVAVIVAYGLILPKPIVEAWPLGAFNVHASLLPRWRGAAPIQRALFAGDRETGITIMQMEEGLDTGPILLQQAASIAPGLTAAELSAELAALGARLIVDALHGVARGALAARPQPNEGATYAHKISREDGRLDWRLPAAVLGRRVRALDPWPGAFFEGPRIKDGGEHIRVLAAVALPGPPVSAPGTVLDEQLSIACSEGVLRPLRVQRAGRAAVEVSAFLRGHPIAAGTVLPCPATS
jgi:methionyl-tRNA formyltransferase